MSVPFCTGACTIATNPRVWIGHSRQETRRELWGIGKSAQRQPGTEKRQRNRLQRAADSDSGDLFAKVSNSTQTTTPRECYNSYGKLENEKPLGVGAASPEPKMEIPAKGILGGQQLEGRRKGTS